MKFALSSETGTQEPVLILKIDQGVIIALVVHFPVVALVCLVQRTRISKIQVSVNYRQRSFSRLQIKAI